MERLDAGDVLAIFRNRIDELERENGTLRDARDELLTALAAQRREVLSLRTMIGQARRSRDDWREKAKARRERVTNLQNRIDIMTNPAHPLHDRHWFAPRRRKVAA